MKVPIGEDVFGAYCDFTRPIYASNRDGENGDLKETFLPGIRRRRRARYKISVPEVVVDARAGH